MRSDVSTGDEWLASTLLLRARKSCDKWAYFTKQNGDSLEMYERGVPKPPMLSVAPSDVLRAVERIRHGDPPLSREYRQRATQALSWQHIPDDVVDVVIQLALWGEVLYWGHADFIHENMLRNDLTPDSPYAIIGI